MTSKKQSTARTIIFGSFVNTMAMTGDQATNSGIWYRMANTLHRAVLVNRRYPSTRPKAVNKAIRRLRSPVATAAIKITRDRQMRTMSQGSAPKSALRSHIV